ncbi:MAG TPA: DEAD/DEAH box helicase [Flavobacteriaceae bacterium]|nr:DEAD/DEAH box helicase [Flavobacteriaceae bacterium]
MSSFKDLGLSENITSALEDLGYKKPTEIQELAIPQILGSDKDLKAFAQTGTGKTAAFALPVLEKIDVNSKSTQAIILSPTRELAIQITKNIKEFAKNIKGLKVVAVYGGANITNQIADLRKGAQIVVGTPGRTVDLINRRSLKLGGVKWVILDEADEMLNMGFKEDIDHILDATPDKKQTLLFSATFPREVEAIARNYMFKPAEISAGTKNQGADTVEHQYYLVSEKNRYPTLKRIVDVNTGIYGIIFCRTRRETQEIADKLIQDGYGADSLHGELSQAQRDIVMKKFRTKKIQILVATDVAARGIDVTDLTHVINHKLPDQLESYTHRSGRTGRAGAEGISIVIVTNKDKRRIQQIERKINKKFIQKEVPSGKEIVGIKLLQYAQKIKAIKVNEEDLSENFEEIAKDLKKLTKDELIKRFIYNELEHLLNYYQKTQDIGGDTGRERVTDENMQRFFINTGNMDGLNPARMIGLINDYLGIKVDIGQIEILKSFSFFEIPKEHTEALLKGFEDAEFNGRSVNVEVTTQPKTRSRNRDRGRGRDRSRSGRRSDSSDRNRRRSSSDRDRGSRSDRSRSSSDRSRGGRDGDFKRRTEKSTRRRRRED